MHFYNINSLFFLLSYKTPSNHIACQNSNNTRHKPAPKEMGRSSPANRGPADSTRSLAHSALLKNKTALHGGAPNLHMNPNRNGGNLLAGASQLHSKKNFVEPFAVV